MAISTNRPITKLEDPVNVSPAALIALAHAGESLPLKAVNIRAMQSGLFLSPFKGRGMEFDESRPYQPGDDVRTLDWKVTARTGRTYTKQFREERERPVLVWLDLRQAMFFATRGAFKSVIAARAAALLAWSAAAHRDRLGGLIFSENIHQEIKPQRGKTAVLHFIQSICRHPAWQQTDAETPSKQKSTADAMLRLRNVARPGSLVFLLSDFRDFDNRSQQHLGQIARHCDVVMLPISDPLESELPPPGQYRVSDGASTAVLDTHATSARQQYHQRYEQQQLAQKRFCQRHHVFLLPLSTQDKVTHALQTGLGLKQLR